MPVVGAVRKLAVPTSFRARRYPGAAYCADRPKPRLQDEFVHRPDSWAMEFSDPPRSTAQRKRAARWTRRH